MIKAKLVGRGPDKRQMMLIGLSAENLMRLTEDKPILTPMDEADFPGIDLMIIYGDTDEAVTQRLADEGLFK